MSQDSVVWRGWITAEWEDIDELKAMGITLGVYVAEDKTWYDCIVPDDLVYKLDTLWDRFSFSLYREL